MTLDIGTTSLRATLHDEEGRALASDQRVNLPVYYPDGRVEQDAVAWEIHIPSILRGIAGKAGLSGVSIAGLSLTAQRSSVIPVDREGQALRPAIMWQDLRTKALCTELGRDDRLIFSTTGLRVGTVYSGIKMLWIRRNEPEVFARTYKMLGIHDFVLHMLTGRFVTDHTLASRTNLFDLEKLIWDAGLTATFGVGPGMLCDLVPPGSVVGCLLSGMARETGLPSGLPVISAGGDQQCAALGLGLFSQDRAITNTGTGSYLIGHSDRPLIDPEMRVSCNVSGLPGAYIVEAALPASGSVFRWFSELFSAGTNACEDDFDSLCAEAEASGPGAKGVLLIPHFNGSGTPLWDSDARGLFFNLSLSTTRGDMARAILEGIAFELGGSLGLLEELCGTVTSVSVSGGLTRAPLFNQIQADVFGKPTLRYPGAEATSLGAWMAGAVATGIAASYPAAFASATRAEGPVRFEPSSENRLRYRELRGRALAVYAALAAPEIRQLFAQAK